MKKSSTWKKFKLLLWKGMIIRKQNYKYLIVELLFPIVLFLSYSVITEKANLYPNDLIEKAQKPPKIHLQKLNSNFNYSTKLCYYPTVGFTKNIMKKVQSKLKLNTKNILDFKNESKFFEYFTESHRNYSIFAVAFQKLNGSSVPRAFVYLIRPYFENIKWNTATLINNDIIQGRSPALGSRQYIDTGFLSLQIALETSFVETVTKNSLPFNIVLQEFPYPRHIKDIKKLTFFTTILPQLIYFGIFFTLVSVTTKPSSEKGTGIKELMKTTGLSSWLIFLSWHLHHMMIGITSILFIVILLTVPIGSAEEALLKYSNFFVIFLFLLLFYGAMISFGLLIASRFDNEITASGLGSFLWLITAILSPNNIKSKNIKMFTSLSPSVAVENICKQIRIYEFQKIGVQWSNIYQPAGNDTNDVTIWEGFQLLCASIILFSVLSLYIEQLYPGRYGVAKSYYFIIYHKALWEKIMQPNKVESGIDIVSDDLRNTEPQASTLRPGIRITQLCKKYGKLRAVDHLSMDIYEGLITVVLGQNGAGKTTTMSIITGMIKATSGTVLIHGEDIQYNMDKIRGFLGYCPQNNIYFADLNIMDHFVFFGMLKGQDKLQAKLQALDILNELHLYDQRNKQAKQLSGGMQRRLSLGIALMGKTKVLILDEPTSGLDLESRRELWNILVKLKKSRMVIITTHFLEEADILADRIAIIDHGQLACYGSPMFLKKLYGSGYRLTIIRDMRLFEEKNPGANQVDTITKMVQEKLKEANLVDSNLNFLTYRLPYDKKSEYSELLNEIENNKENLCVSHIEMSVTTLEEVYLKAGSFAAKDYRELKFKLQSSATLTMQKKLSMLQLDALLKKRWLVFKSRYLMYIAPALVGILLYVLVLHLTYKTTVKMSEGEVKFDVKLHNYGKTTVYYSTNNKTGYFSKMKKQYDRLVEEQSSDAYEIDDVHQEILKKGEENFEFYRQKLIVAAEFIDAKPRKSANAMFSNPSLHGAVISVNLLCNSILRTLKNENHSIKSSISPLFSGKFNSQNNNGFQRKTTIKLFIYWVILFPIGLLFLASPFMILPQMENSSKLKQLQLMSGVHPLVYWSIFYIIDLAFYFICTIPIISIMLIYQNAASFIPFNQSSDCCKLMVIVVVYGLSIIPFTYLFSYARLAVDGMTRYMWCYALSYIYLLTIWKILPAQINYLFALHPQYGLLYLLTKFLHNASNRYTWSMTSAEERILMCQDNPNPCCDNVTSKECYNYNFFENGKTDEFVKYIMISSTFMYFAIILLLEKQYLQKIFETLRLMICRVRKTTGGDNQEDVKLQQERISEILNRDLNKRENIPMGDIHDDFLVYNLEKSFKRTKVVKHISFSVDVGECFGLLGVSGAGKTIIFQMLTGNLPVTNGKCRIISPSGERLYLTKTSRKYLSNIGYCPQQDIFEEVLTGHQMLTLFGKLRGLSEGLEEEIQIFAKCLAFDDILNQACGGYSGGNKRKLNIAVALIGVPRVILLDEPTRGVDPVSRRAMWDMIKLIQNQIVKPAIVLTSHSIEECEILCNKIAIMKAGEFQCYGTLPQLKTKYAHGFKVTLKLNVDNDAAQLQMVQNLKSKLIQLYADTCVLTDEQATLLQYHITDLSKKLSEMFQDIDKLQEEFSIIEDYTIMETTLEQVFLKLAQSN